MELRRVKAKNCPLLLSSLRGLVICKNNCGKNTILLNLLLQLEWLDYNHLYVFGRSLNQMEYIILQKGFEIKLSKEQVGNIFKKKICNQAVW